jgi:hypothetical protein
MRRTVIAASRRTPCFRGKINACPGRSRPAHAPRGARYCPQNLAPRLLTHRCACGEAPDTAQSSRFATCPTGPAVSLPSVSGRCSAMPSTIPICRPFREARRVRKRSGGDTEVLCAAGAGNKNPDFRGFSFVESPLTDSNRRPPPYHGEFEPDSREPGTLLESTFPRSWVFSAAGHALPRRPLSLPENP